MDKLKIHVIIGSIREGRFGDKPAHYTRDLLAQDERIDAELVDLRDWPLPLYDKPKAAAYVTNGDYEDAAVNRWATKVKEADGFVVMASEYNHGYTAVLKNALDVIYAEWARKPITFVGYGNVGGARARSSSYGRSPSSCRWRRSSQRCTCRFRCTSRFGASRCPSTRSTSRPWSRRRSRCART